MPQPMDYLSNYALLKTYKLRTKLYFLLFVGFLGFLISGLFSYNTLVTYTVNGPVYNQIQQNEDLIADILPPPVFIVESYLNAYRLLEIIGHSDGATLAALQAETAVLQQKYETQRDFWQETLPEGEIKQILFQEAVPSADAFYEVYEQEFVPTVLDGKKEEADLILHEKLEPLFFSHRTAINQVVDLTSARNQEIETQTADRVAFTINFSLVLRVVTVIAVIFTALGISNPVVQQITQINKIATQVAKGDLSQTVLVRSQDEIGSLATNFNLMTKQLKTQVDTLEEQVQKRTQALSNSVEFGRFLSTILDEQELLTKFVAQLRTSFNYTHIHLYLLNQEQNSLQVPVGTGENRLVEQTQIPTGQGYIGQVIQTNTSRLWTDKSVKTDTDALYLLPDTEYAVWVPISQGDLVLGVLDVQNSKGNKLGQTDIDFLQSVANQLAISLNNVRTYSQAQTRAQQEALINSISQKIDAAQTVESVLQTAVRELGRALQAKQTHIHLQTKTAVDPTQ